MKKAVPAIVLFVLFLSCCLPAASQYSVNDQLFAAAGRGDSSAIQPLLDKGANIEARNNDGLTALIVAAVSGQTETVRLLLDKGANIEAKNSNGDTALIFAAYNSRTDVMLLLLEKGADIEAKDNQDDTALLQAACFEAKADVNRTEKAGMVKLLLDKGANIEAKDNRGLTPLTCPDRMKPPEEADLLEQANQQEKQIEQANPREAFAAYLSRYQQHPQDDSLREKILKVAPTLPERPAIPEAARQLFTAATDQIKQANTPSALDQPIALLRKALEIAPWWGNAYYNLSRVLEMRGQYDDAAKQLNYYLELKPAEADAQQARAHLVVIQTEKDAAAQAQARQNADNENLVKAADAQHPLQAPVDNGRLKNQQMAATNPPARSKAWNPLPDPKLVWTDPATGLEWTKRDNAVEVDWEQANAYCANLRMGGAGWRLPTIDELLGIYDPSVNVPGYQGYPKLGYDVVWHVKGNLKLSGVHWSSSIRDNPGHSFFFYFVNGNHDPIAYDSSRGMRALCVRSSGD